MEKSSYTKIVGATLDLYAENNRSLYYQEIPFNILFYVGNHHVTFDCFRCFRKTQ